MGSRQGERLPRRFSITLNINDGEVNQNNDNALRSEDTVSIATPYRAESVYSDETTFTHIKQCELVVSSYKKVKLGLIIVCALNFLLIIVGMILIAVLFVVSRDGKPHIPTTKHSSLNEKAPSEFKLSPNVKRQPSQKSLWSESQEMFIKNIKVDCADINKHLYYTGKTGNGTCSFGDIPKAAEKYINAEVRKIRHATEDSKRRQHALCCKSRPFLHMEGKRPQLIKDHPARQCRMQEWYTDIHQSISSKNGEIYIPSAGAFYLYSRLEIDGGCVDKDSFPVTQSVLIKKAKSPTYELERVILHKCPGNKTGHNLSMEQIFYLHPGDRIQLIFKYPDCVSPTLQHVGIFRI